MKLYRLWFVFVHLMILSFSVQLRIVIVLLRHFLLQCQQEINQSDHLTGNLSVI